MRLLRNQYVISFKKEEVVFIRYFCLEDFEFTNVLYVQKKCYDYSNNTWGSFSLNAKDQLSLRIFIEANPFKLHVYILNDEKKKLSLGKISKYKFNQLSSIYSLDSVEYDLSQLKKDREISSKIFKSALNIYSIKLNSLSITKTSSFAIHTKRIKFSELQSIQYEKINPRTFKIRYLNNDKNKTKKFSFRIKEPYQSSELQNYFEGIQQLRLIETQENWKEKLKFSLPLIIVFSLIPFLLKNNLVSGNLSKLFDEFELRGRIGRIQEAFEFILKFEIGLIIIALSVALFYLCLLLKSIINPAIITKLVKVESNYV